MHLFIITIGLCVVYAGLLFFLPRFLNVQAEGQSRPSLISLTLIIVLSVVGYVISFSIPHAELANRVLHGFGGGVMVTVVCFLAIRDLRLPISTFQFFMFSLLLVSALGVANEILELFMQLYMERMFATSINDTWYDLLSNTIGGILATLLFVPFIKKRGSSSRVVER